MSNIAITIYRVCEAIDGERGLKILPYRIAQRIKLYCMLYI